MGCPPAILNGELPMWDIAHQQVDAYINGIGTQIAASPMLIIDFATFWARYQDLCRQETVDASHPLLRYRVLPFRQASLESRWNPHCQESLGYRSQGSRYQDCECPITPSALIM